MTHTKWMLATAVLLIAFGTGCSKVPDLSGMTQEQAKEALDKKKLQMGTVTVASLPGRTAGTVIDQDPKADAKIPDNKTISLVMQADASTTGSTTGATTGGTTTAGNTGGATTTGGTQGTVNPNLVPVPSFIGQTQNDAEVMLNQLGLVLGKVDVVINDKPAGKIFGQDPPANTPVPLGTMITFSVSSDALVSVPQVIGQTQAAAEQMIRNAQLIPESEGAIHEGADPIGNIVAQDVPQGLRIAKGQTVHLSIKQEAATVPHVVGTTLQQAQITLYQNNLTPVVHYVLDGANVGRVTAQTEPDNKLLAKGAPVGITVGQLDLRLIGRYQILQRPQAAMSQTIQMNRVVSAFKARGQ